MLGTACFLTGFWSKKEQNGRFQANSQGKTLIVERQYFQNVTVFYDRYICFFDVFVQHRTKRDILDQFSGKNPYNRTTIFTKRNGFFDRYIVFSSFHLAKN